VTDKQEQVVPSVPPRRRKAPQERTPPPRRNGNGQEPSLTDVLNAVNGVRGDVADLTRRVEQVESGGMRYVESEPPSKPDARAVNPDALDPFTRKLWEDRTRDTPPDFGGDREPLYNVEPRLYLKNDGTYVWLQGDARSRAYYTDKGYYCCTPDEVAEYRKREPAIVAQQREKAHLIAAIRRLIDTDSALVGHRSDADADTELDLMSIDQLHQTWRSLCAETSQPDRPLPPPKRWRSEGRDRAMAGVETTPPPSRMREFDAEMDQAARARRGGRAIEINQRNAGSFA
jgi:hypothetical protein